MQKNIFVITVIVISIIVLSGVVILWMNNEKSRGQPIGNTADQNAPNIETEVATDPRFPEIKGKLMSGFPEIPVYPGATLIASAKTNRANEQDTGYRAKWETQDAVVKVMKWYQEELPKSGWVYETPNDPNASGEQVAQIKKSDLEGFLEAEREEKGTEIVVEVRITK